MNRYKIILILSTLFLIQCVQKNNREIASVIHPRFEACSNEKSQYLEKQLSALPFEYLNKNESSWNQTIPLACIQFAQKNFRGSFAYCKNEFEKPLMNAPRPCLSENYTRLVYNAYHDVTNCFNLDPKNSFLQIMIESGFHINAINQTGFDAGIGQFTGNGIKRVMEKSIINKTSQLLLESSNPSCERIAGVFKNLQKDAFKLEQRCSMIALPENPYRSLLLHYLHGLRDQLSLKKLLLERPAIAKVLNQEILEQLVFMAYNRGIQGTLKLIDGYVENRRKLNAEITSENLNLWKNLSQARKILKNDPEKRRVLKNSKIKKLSLAEYAMIHDQNYLGAMAEAGELVQARVGDQCF